MFVENFCIEICAFGITFSAPQQIYHFKDFNELKVTRPDSECRKIVWTLEATRHKCEILVTCNVSTVDVHYPTIIELGK